MSIPQRNDGAMIAAPDHEIVIIGAGLGGLGMAIALRRAGIDEFVIFERADDVGGVWRDNTYPAVGADVPSFTYQFSFHKNPRWSRVFPKGHEIKAYIDDCADTFDVRRHIEFGCEVVDRYWDEDTRMWRIQVGSRTVTARFVISALGAFVNPKTPLIDGLDSFGGEVMITQRWDDSVDLSGRRVAVIGTGATSVQLVPEVADSAGHVTVFQRRPIYVLPKIDFPIPASAQDVLARIPVLQAALRLVFAAQVEVLLVSVVALGEPVKPLTKALAGLSKAFLYAQVRDRTLREQLLPRYEFGCKRPSVSNRWYRAFTKPNVELVTDTIDKITATGVVAGGREHPADVLVLATGFHFAHDPANFRKSPVRTSTGFDLADCYEQERLHVYEGVSLPELPNSFMVFGPYSWTGSSYHLMVETQARHIVRVITEARRRRATRVAVTCEATDEFMALIHRRAQTSLLNLDRCEGANSYYFDQHGDFSALRPTSGAQAWLASRRFPLSAYTYDSEGQPLGSDSKSEGGVGLRARS